MGAYFYIFFKKIMIIKEYFNKNQTKKGGEIKLL